MIVKTNKNNTHLLLLFVISVKIRGSCSLCKQKINTVGGPALAYPDGISVEK